MTAKKRMSNSRRDESDQLFKNTAVATVLVVLVTAVSMIQYFALSARIDTLEDKFTEHTAQPAVLSESTVVKLRNPFFRKNAPSLLDGDEPESEFIEMTVGDIVKEIQDNRYETIQWIRGQEIVPYVRPEEESHKGSSSGPPPDPDSPSGIYMPHTGFDIFK